MMFSRAFRLSRRHDKARIPDFGENDKKNSHFLVSIRIIG
jgi:hypothetical protein